MINEENQQEIEVNEDFQKGLIIIGKSALGLAALAFAIPICIGIFIFGWTSTYVFKKFKENLVVEDTAAQKLHNSFKLKPSNFGL